MVNHHKTAKRGLNLPRLLDTLIAGAITIGKINCKGKLPNGIPP
jgi:hypothetical protein